MEVWSSETAGSWMVPRSRGMVAAVALGAALMAVYAVLAALALTAPNALTVPNFGSVVRADAGSFTALFHDSRPARHAHVLAAVTPASPPAVAPLATPNSATTPVSHSAAPKHYGGRHAAFSRRDDRRHRHGHDRRHGHRRHGHGQHRFHDRRVRHH